MRMTPQKSSREIICSRNASIIYTQARQMISMKMLHLVNTGRYHRKHNGPTQGKSAVSFISPEIKVEMAFGTAQKVSVTLHTLLVTSLASIDSFVHREVLLSVLCTSKKGWSNGNIRFNVLVDPCIASKGLKLLLGRSVCILACEFILITITSAPTLYQNGLQLLSHYIKGNVQYDLLAFYIISCFSLTFIQFRKYITTFAPIECAITETCGSIIMLVKGNLTCITASTHTLLSMADITRTSIIFFPSCSPSSH